MYIYSYLFFLCEWKDNYQRVTIQLQLVAAAAAAAVVVV